MKSSFVMIKKTSEPLLEALIEIHGSDDSGSPAACFT